MSDNAGNQQAQSQSQNTSLQVTIANSSDPALERRIFSSVASTGRQLGRIAAVLDLLVAAFERTTTVETDAAEAIAAYRSMRAEIEREKAARAPERFIEALETLRSEDPRAYAELLPRLRQWVRERADDDAPPTSAPLPTS
jgi:hypothetical protein